MNLDEISETIDGYSGADITNVCRDACYMPLRNRIRGVNPEELRRMAVDEGNIHDHILSRKNQTCSYLRLFERPKAKSCAITKSA